MRKTLHCHKHGETEFAYYEKHKRWRCLRCQTEATQKRREALKLMAVEYKGGKCERCGYNHCIAALEFHHMGDKDFGIGSRGYTKSWEKVRLEVDKCLLLCANCHREIHHPDH